MLSVDESGYHQLPSNNSWNHKCNWAVGWVLSGLVSIGCFFTQDYMVVGATLAAGCFYSVYHYPGLLLAVPSTILTCLIRTEEFLSLSLFPRHTEFEQRFSEIRSEVDRMLQSTRKGKDLVLTRDTYSGESTLIGRDVRIENNETFGWRLLMIKCGNELSPYARHFPVLTELLEDPSISSCAISVLEPGVTIPIHVGYYKGIMRYMLPTHVPSDRENVFLCVNGKKYNWTEGKSLLWDDTFPHKVYNLTSEPRVVIYMDIIRPLPWWLDSFNRMIVGITVNSPIVKKEVQRTEKQIKLM
jgi:aspartyl/asparaginyl beta-hydroxylase (cupin superfamily)